MIPLDQQLRPPHYLGVHCPTCRQDVLPLPTGICPWCDGRLVCRNGHTMTEQNLRVRRDRNGRICRDCERAHGRARYWRNPEAERARRLANYYKRKARA